jgi:hypothetical protein
VTLFREIAKVTAMFSENHTKSVNILSEQIAEILRHFRKIAKKKTVIFVRSIYQFVRPHGTLGTQWTVFHEARLLKTFQTILSTLHDHLCTFMTVPRRFLLIMRRFSKKVVQEIRTHFVFNNFFSDNRTAYKIVWKYMVKVAGHRQQQIMAHARFILGISKYVILIDFPR